MHLLFCVASLSSIFQCLCTKYILNCFISKFSTEQKAKPSQSAWVFSGTLWLIETLPSLKGESVPKSYSSRCDTEETIKKKDPILEKKNGPS